MFLQLFRTLKLFPSIQKCYPNVIKSNFLSRNNGRRRNKTILFLIILFFSVHHNIIISLPRFPFVLVVELEQRKVCITYFMVQSNDEPYAVFLNYPMNFSSIHLPTLSLSLFFTHLFPLQNAIQINTNEMRACS